MAAAFVLCPTASIVRFSVAKPIAIAPISASQVLILKDLSIINAQKTYINMTDQMNGLVGFLKCLIITGSVGLLIL